MARIKKEIEEINGKEQEEIKIATEPQSKQKENSIAIRVRGFEYVNEKHKKNKESNIKLPTRGSKHSAGYDFYMPYETAIPPHGVSLLIYTDVKAYMQEDEYLSLHIRSSLGFKKGLSLANTTGIIDSDYYNNTSNEGNIAFALINSTDKWVVVKKGERVVQGIFTKYLVVDNEEELKTRKGGLGSTDK